MRECRLLDGEKLSIDLLAKVALNIKEKNIHAKLVVVFVGDSPVSMSYIQKKHDCAKRVGIDFELVHLSRSVTEDEVINSIQHANHDPSVTGILVQLPLPSSMDTQRVLDSIDFKKDVDGLTSFGRDRLVDGNESLVCCTPKGILRLLDGYNIDLKNKKIVLIGHGYLVGQPLAMMLKNRGLNFTVCDKETTHIQAVAKDADILISATGVPNLVSKNYVKDGAIVVDAGTVEFNNKIVGDIEFFAARSLASWITPVPGGVGPMTVAMLMENILEAHKLQEHDE